MMSPQNWKRRLGIALKKKPSQVVFFLDPARNTESTLVIMRFLSYRGRYDPFVKKATLEAIENVRGSDKLGEIQAIDAWLKNNIRFTKDVLGMETLQSAKKTLEIRRGDCDDVAILAGSMLMSIGFPTRFVTIGVKKPSHVWTEAKVADKWIVVDPTRPHQTDLTGYRKFHTLNNGGF